MEVIYMHFLEMADRKKQIEDEDLFELVKIDEVEALLSTKTGKSKDVL
jgi:hypothetical protein